MPRRVKRNRIRTDDLGRMCPSLQAIADHYYEDQKWWLSGGGLLTAVFNPDEYFDDDDITAHQHAAVVAEIARSITGDPASTVKAGIKHCTRSSGWRAPDWWTPEVDDTPWMDD